MDCSSRRGSPRTGTPWWRHLSVWIRRLNCVSRSLASARPSPRPARWESPTVPPDEEMAPGPPPDGGLGLKLDTGVRETRLLNDSPWVRSLGRLELSVGTEGWKFPAPPVEYAPPPRLAADPPAGRHEVKLSPLPDAGTPAKPRVRARPTADTVLFKDRLLYLLQPPLDGLFDGRQLEVPFEPFPYQLEGIAFLMPRHGALLADEMGLGKTAQAILAMRLLFHQGQIKQALVVCPKALIHNWARELKLWAPDIPFETFEGDPDQRRSMWLVSNCPLKLVNYETLTRDVELATDKRVSFDVVVLDEAQRIKNKE